MSLPETMKALICYGNGAEAKIEEVPVPKPGKNEVLVKIEFAPINPADLMTIHGVYPIPVKPPHPVGLEASGVIAALGEDLKLPHKVGDKVHLHGLGTFGQYLVTSSEACRTIQEGLSLEEAACHVANPATVVSFGHIVSKGGHKAAIHTAGASALGRMMIRYFKPKGIKLINVVRRDEYIEELKKEGADYVLNSEAPDFEEKLREIAHKEGATVAFEAVCGDLTTKILRNQPNDSTVYVYGALSDGTIKNVGVQEFIFQGKTISGFWLLQYMQKSGAMLELLNESYSLLPTILKSSIQKVFKLEDIKEALAFYTENSSKGKILIKPN